MEDLSQGRLIYSKDGRYIFVITMDVLNKLYIHQMYEMDYRSYMLYPLSDIDKIKNLVTDEDYQLLQKRILSRI